MTAKKEKIDTYSKNSFYRSLDYIAKNKDEILRNLNAKICANTNRKIDVLWFDATTTYFETFSREGYKNLAIQKMENLKSQIVIGWQLMKMGYRYTTKYFQEMLLIQILSTILLEIADIYEVNSVTIIADKGMSVNRNIRFLESKNWKYIISYRMKAGSKQFKGMY